MIHKQIINGTLSRRHRIMRTMNIFPLILTLFPILSVAFGTDGPGPIYHFQSETVWGKLTVLIQPFKNQFHLECQSDTAVSAWFLKDGKGKKIAAGSADGANSFKDNIQQSFQGSYQLTVLVKEDQEPIPLVVPLSPGGDTVWLTPTPPPYDPYVENPGHSYDKIVRSLYDQATQAYVAGNDEKALECLEKAEGVDPAQPQVETLLDKIKDSVETIASAKIVQNAASDWKAGNTDQALDELGNFLRKYPKDIPALQLQQRIQKSQVPTPAPKKRRSRNLIAKPTPTRQPTLSEKDRQSQADEAYNLGLESYRKEDYASAKKFWEETLRLEPTYIQAQRNLNRLTEEHPELK